MHLSLYNVYYLIAKQACQNLKIIIVIITIWRMYAMDTQPDNKIPYLYFIEKLIQWLRDQVKPGIVFLELSDPDVENDKFTERDYIALYGEEIGRDEYQKSVIRDSMDSKSTITAGLVKRYTMVPESVLPYSQDEMSLYQDDVFEEDSNFVANKVELHDPKHRFFDLVINLDEAYFYYSAYDMPSVKNEIRKMLTATSFLKTRRQNTNLSGLLNKQGADLYQHLQTIRTNIAKENNVSPFIILTNRSLYDMCLQQPMTKDELICVYGIGNKRADKYGKPFLNEIKRFTGGRRFQAELEESHAG